MVGTFQITLNDLVAMQHTGEFASHFRYVLTVSKMNMRRLQMYWEMKNPTSGMTEVKLLEIKQERSTFRSYSFTPAFVPAAGATQQAKPLRHNAPGAGHTFKVSFGEFSPSEPGGRAFVPTLENAKTMADQQAALSMTFVKMVAGIIAFDCVDYTNRSTAGASYMSGPYEAHIEEAALPKVLPQKYRLNHPNNIAAYGPLMGGVRLEPSAEPLQYKAFKEIIQKYMETLCPADIAAKYKHADKSKVYLTCYWAMLDYRTADKTNSTAAILATTPAILARDLPLSNSSLKGVNQPRIKTYPDGSQIALMHPWDLYPHGTGATPQAAVGNVFYAPEIVFYSLSAWRNVVNLVYHFGYAPSSGDREDFPELPDEFKNAEEQPDIPQSYSV
jgi:hypothetical protein